MGMCKSMPWDWHLVRLVFCLTLGCFLVMILITYFIFSQDLHFNNNNIINKHRTLALKDSASVKTQGRETEKVRKKGPCISQLLIYATYALIAPYITMALSIVVIPVRP